MLVLDVNVLIAVHRADHPHHATVRAWFDEVVRGDEDFGVPQALWGSFLRICTHRRVFTVPTPTADVFAFVHATIAQPRHLEAEPGPRHLGVLEELCREADVTGDLVPDAVLGAIALEHGATVATLDRDFARFRSVRHIRPGG